MNDKNILKECKKFLKWVNKKERKYLEIYKKSKEILDYGFEEKLT